MLPTTALATYVNTFQSALRRVGRPLQIAAGSILVLMGVAMMTGTLASFGTWMLTTFPIFQTLVI